MYDREKVSAALKAFRLSHNLKQEDIAAIVGISIPSVSRWESGLNQPTIENLWKLSDYFGVTIGKLLGKE